MNKYKKYEELSFSDDYMFCMILTNNLNLCKKLLELILKIEIKKIAPLGDPIDIMLRGYELCIRKSDMKSIDVRVI